MKHKYIITSVVGLALLWATAAWPQVNLNPLPSRVLGRPVTPQVEQLSIYSINPNLVEGRELYQPMGIAIDSSGAAPAVYVSDTGNNRVLGWKNAANLSNGQKADTVVGQVDFFTTWPQGPGLTAYAPGQGTPLQSELYSPTGLAVDRNGNLYVADCGNNRILRYPEPFTNLDHIPDLVIGQPNFNSRTANYTGQVSAQGIFLSSSAATLQSNMAIDSSGNLWMTDPGNRRVLEFAAADLAKGGGGLTAVLEIGQADFTSLKTNLNPGSATANPTTDQFAVPSAIAFDPQGRLFVSDSDANNPKQLSRVLVFEPPFKNAMPASRIMGVFQSTAIPTLAQIYSTEMDDPEGIFFLPNNQIGVVDSGYNRILIFPSYDQWPAQTTQFSPTAAAVVGHNSDFTRTGANDAAPAATFLPSPSTSVLFVPMAAALFNGELFVADSQNNRVLVMPLQPSSTQPTFGAATRVLGQDRMDTGSINLIEGKELQLSYYFQNSNLRRDSGLAIDSTGDTPHLYVADSGNNRVLGYKDMRKAGPGSGSVADIVIGQQNGQTALCNYPTGDPAQPTNSSLCGPVGLLVDSQGNLWVADQGNARVLRFPAPFSQTGQPVADLVLGQSSFTSKVTDPTQSTMASPYGLAITVPIRIGSSMESLLLASDQVHNRILVFQSVNGVFQSGQAAAKVIGQPDFHSSAAGSDLLSFSSPHHIAVDTSSLVYVADTGNNRVLIFNSADKLPVQHPTAVWPITGLSAPEGVYVSPQTGEIWVADTNNGQALRYPNYDSLVTGAASSFSLRIPGYSLALAQDQFGALAVADSTNRVAFYFPRLAMQNAANFLDASIHGLAPGMWASIYPYAGQLTNGQSANSGGQIPFPTTLVDTEVLFNGVAAPMSYVAPGQINFYIPMGAPTNVLADVQVVRQSTGQVLGATYLPMNTVAPALFIDLKSSGTSRQALVINHDDGTVNSSTNPAKRGSYVELYGTGQGFIAGAPGTPGSPYPDGTPTPFSPLFWTADTPRVFLGAAYLGDTGSLQGPGGIQFSGLAPGLVGVWQINIQIPPNVDVTKPAILLVQLDYSFSAGLNLTGYNTVIYVK
jgi:uncharacterized protein (TIGR03437 family)